MVFANYMPNPDKGSSVSTQRNGMEYPLGCLEIVRVEMPYSSWLMASSDSDIYKLEPWQCFSGSSYTFGRTMYLLYSQVIDRIIQKGGTVSADMRRVVSRLISAFSNQKVRKAVVDYGRRYNAVTLDLLVDDGLEFVARVEIDKEDPSVVFSIRREGDLLFMGDDRLADFQRHVDAYFLKRREIDASRDEVSYYVS